MHLSLLVQMIESGLADRPLLGTREDPVTGTQLGEVVRTTANTLAGREALVYAGENHPLLPVALFAAAWAGVPFIPINYRLTDQQLNALVNRVPGALVLTDPGVRSRLEPGPDVQLMDDWLASTADEPVDLEPATDDDAVAVVLYTSGTTSEPKAALLRHRHLMAYLFGTVEFASADEGQAMLVSVPPYHVAGVANMLSNLFAGRRLVYMRTFEPGAWLDTVAHESITNAMVVPTMLARIVTAMEHSHVQTPSLRSLSYGGAKVAERVLRDALRLFPDTDFVNAYGLTETASTIAVLGPEDHRLALSSQDELVQRRLLSVGQLLPTIEIEVREENGALLPAGSPGLIFLRGEQISGEYAGGSVLDEDGWFSTRDRGHVDADGYLYLEGRADDTIIRGGENIAPAEVEEALRSHLAVEDACVVGVPDDEWGQRIAAAVVLRHGRTVSSADLQRHVRTQLRGAKVPDLIQFRSELPHTDTGKLLRRVVLSEFVRSSKPD